MELQKKQWDIVHSALAKTWNVETQT
jgi:hypothetical protein